MVNVGGKTIIANLQMQMIYMFGVFEYILNLKGGICLAPLQI